MSVSANLIAYLKSNDIWYRLIEKDTTIHTADAAAATGIPLERITKSLIFLLDNEPVVIIIPGNCRVDSQKVKQLLGVQNVTIVPFEEAETYSGYPAGGTPPVHYENVTRVILDRRVLNYETVFGGGGTRRKLHELRSSDVQKLNNALVADVAVERSSRTRAKMWR